MCLLGCLLSFLFEFLFAVVSESDMTDAPNIIIRGSVCVLLYECFCLCVCACANCDERVVMK